MRVAEIVNQLRGTRSKSEIVKNPNTLRRMERGERASPHTLRYIEGRLELPTGTLDHVLETGELPPKEEGGERDVVYAFESAGEVFDGIAGLTDEERAEVLATLRRGLERIRARNHQ